MDFLLPEREDGSSYAHSLPGGFPKKWSRRGSWRRRGRKGAEEVLREEEEQRGRVRNRGESWGGGAERRRE